MSPVQRNTPKHHGRISKRRGNLLALAAGTVLALMLLAVIDVTLGALEARNRPVRLFEGVRAWATTCWAIVSRPI